MTGVLSQPGDLNPFAPPSSKLLDRGEPAESLRFPRPSFLQRLGLIALGFALPVLLYVAVALASVALATIFANRRFGFFFSLFPIFLLGCVLGYFPISLSKLHRTGATLPMRLLGYRFIREDGHPAGLLRTWLFWWLPGFLLFFLPSFIALKFAESLPAALAWSGSGPLLHFIDIFMVRRRTRRTLRDQFAGLIMVKP